ncbi:acylneuraminate cytidylyltransferase family protein [Pseudobutyrivibrio sp.]|uniref:acylneuraminate cytidylyltransferase family protein n=1 Tax=Pseudobutyrivibrio sp. TaxID=2014367 RepID=UPI001DDBC761|nr:acylneuraminate cytidylyltransferase family protein [Pseudobutyrivibrio sp.]MBE5910046.1 acylneuraminate cytidylyltransferase family protein [Pseudobutyrivibrio sp.]
MKKIAIIPARSGSKGIKDKNIIDFDGKPMMAYSIEAAMDSNCFSQIIVSTDSTKYGSIAKEYGADVVYRDERVSNDLATTYMVIKDLYTKIEHNHDYFVLLQPTSPLRTYKHIQGAIELFEERYNDYDFLVSVKEAEHSRLLVNPIDKDLSLKYFDVDYANYRRQSYKDYVPNGSIFIAKIEAYFAQKHFFGAKSLAYIMNDLDSVDVDTELDYKFALLCMEERKRMEK